MHVFSLTSKTGALWIRLRVVSFPLMELPESVVTRITNHLEAYSALMLWITGDRRLQAILKDHTKHLSAVLPAGFWAIPWTLVRNFEAAKHLTIGFPRYAYSWDFADMDPFKPMAQLQRLTLQGASMLRHMTKGHVSLMDFPKLTHLTLFIHAASELSETSTWSIPNTLQHLEVNTADFDSPTSFVTYSYNVVDARKVTWLTKIPNSVRSLHLQLFVSCQPRYGDTLFRWPNKLESLTIGFSDISSQHSIQACDVDPTEHPIPSPASPVVSTATATASSSTATLKYESTIDYAKAMREAKKAEKAAANSSTPAPAVDIPLAPIVVADPYYRLPPTVLHAVMLFVRQPDTIEPDALPPRIRTFRISSADRVYTASAVDLFYKARPTLQIVDIGYQANAQTVYNKTGSIATIAGLQAVPCYAQYLSVQLCKAHLSSSTFAKMLPPSVTEMDIFHVPIKPLGTNTEMPEETISTFPHRLRTLRLHLKNATKIILPPTLTSLLVTNGRLKSGSVFPQSLTELEMSYWHSGDLRCFPSTLTRLSLSVSIGKLASAEFSAQLLPRSLRHLSIAILPGLSWSTRTIKWWSEMPRDLPLETLEINYYDGNTKMVHSRIQGPPPLPFIHPTLHSIIVTLYEVPLETAVHVLSNLPRGLYNLTFGVFQGEQRECPTVPGSLIDTLPPLLDTMRSNFFDKEAIQRWNRQLAARKAVTFDDNPSLYTYCHRL